MRAAGTPLASRAGSLARAITNCSRSTASALDLYERYLGEEAEGMPGTALSIPDDMESDNPSHSLVRAVMGSIGSRDP